MAPPKLTSRFLIMLGDGATPTELFAHPCGANARSVTLTNNTGEETVLDCDDPLDAPAALYRWTETQDTALKISGTVATQSFAMWREWADSGDVKNIKIMLDESAVNNGGSWQLPAILDQFELGTEGKGVVKFDATISGAGRRIWTDAP